MQNINTRLANIKAEIQAACEAAGRAADEVRLLAVSKTQQVDRVEAAINAGQMHFGENYLQEAMEKVDALPDVNWHFIGAIQSNKTRDIAARFDWVHSIASTKVARRLSDQRPANLPPIETLIQVNISNEAQKSGVVPEDTPALVDDMLQHANIRVRGLMAIPSPSDTPEAQRKPFDQLRLLRDEIATSRGLENFDQLSMGMSGDFHAAINAGATWIRIGTAIFGPRESKQ